MTNYQVESGFQLFARLNVRPKLENVYPELFANFGPKGREVIEIVGDTSTGKTFIVTEILARCLLPDSFDNININGKNAGAIILNTDHHFHIFNLIKIMECILKKCTNNISCFSSTQITNIIQSCLKNLIILNCYDSQQLYLTIQNLDNIISNNSKVILVVMDSLSAYYWSDRLCGGLKRMDLYQKKLLKLLQTVTKEYNLTIMFTKYSGFSSKRELMEVCCKQPTLEKINYRILLEKKNNVFTANVSFPDNTNIVKTFRINNIVEWIE